MEAGWPATSLKDPDDWAPQHTKGTASANPERLLDEMYTKCKRLWVDPRSGWQQKLVPAQHRTCLPKLTQRPIGEAGLTIAYDGFHPRHY